jgi:DNA-binding transcriptional LysR family regulator
MFHQPQRLIRVEVVWRRPANTGERFFVLPSSNAAIVAGRTSFLALVLSQTNGVATLPRQLLQRYDSLVELVELPFEMPPFRLAMAWDPRAQNDQAGPWLRECFLKRLENAAV